MYMEMSMSKPKCAHAKSLSPSTAHTIYVHMLRYFVQAQAGLQGRFFAGKQIQANYLAQAVFDTSIP